MKDFLEEFKSPLKIAAAAVLIVFSIWTMAITIGIADDVKAIRKDGETPAADAVKIITETKVEYVEIPKYIFIEERPAIEVTSGEREMLARLVYREARGESIECQRAVVSVVINRMNKNGESVKETIFAKGQFSTAGSLDRTTPTETQYEAVDYVLMHGSTLPPYVLYFSGGHPHGWAGYQVYAVIDNTYFGFMEV